MKEMDQNEAEHAAYQIEGYMFLRPNESGCEAAFIRAKEDCLRNLRRAVECAESITCDDIKKMFPKYSKYSDIEEK